MSQRLQSIFTVSVSVLGSRVLGLARDAMTAAFLGVSIASNAFLFAFAIPNLFRRMFGEGALTSAFIPVLSDQAHKGKDDAAAFRFVNQVLVRLAIGTVALAVALGVLFTIAYWAIWYWNEQDGYVSNPMVHQWMLGSQLTVFMIAYMPLICVTAILGAVLNTRNRFAVPALSNVLLNVGMIGALLIGGLAMKLPPERLVWWLSAGVLMGGVLQLATAAWALWLEGWRPRIERGPTEGLDALMRLFIPGLWGAAILQINVMVSRFLAFGLNETATTTLNYAHRLIELPLGMFAVAIATVIFPQMSLMVSSDDKEGLVESYGHGLRLMIALTAPAAVGLVVLHRPILQLLFQWGRFSDADVALTGPVLMILALAVPQYAINTLMTRAFHALKDTKTPVKYAGVTFAVNLIASLVLMGPLEAKGLAIAGLLAATTQTVLMVRGLRKKRPELSGARVKRAVMVVSAAALGMAITAYSMASGVELWLGETKQSAVVICILVIPASALLYFGILFALKFEDRDEVTRLVGRFIRR
ncbi:MAG: murein biosynthesis integral membrane protein MurJ [Puniceicoccales bacterium]